MIVIEQYSDIVDGKRVTGRREVERPDVITEDEAILQAALSAQRERDDAYTTLTRARISFLVPYALIGDLGAKDEITDLLASLPTKLSASRTR